MFWYNKAYRHLRHIAITKPNKNWVPHLSPYHQQQQGRRLPVAPVFFLQDFLAFKIPTLFTRQHCFNIRLYRTIYLFKRRFVYTARETELFIRVAQIFASMKETIKGIQVFTAILQCLNDDFSIKIENLRNIIQIHNIFYSTKYFICRDSRYLICYHLRRCNTTKTEPLHFIYFCRRLRTIYIDIHSKQNFACGAFLQFKSSRTSFTIHSVYAHIQVYASFLESAL